MRLNRQLQYALLLVLYLARSGRARLKDVAVGLRVSLGFLRLVAYELVRGHVINSVKGPGGGYEINGDPAVRDVLGGLHTTLFLTGRESMVYNKGEPEHRALAKLAHGMSLSLAPLMRMKIRALNNALATSEMAALDKLTGFAQVN